MRPPFLPASVAFDRGLKLSLHATHGVREVWLADLNTRSIEVYRDPQGSGYASSQTFTGTQACAFLAFPDDAIGVREIFGAETWGGNSE